MGLSQLARGRACSWVLSLWSLGLAWLPERVHAGNDDGILLGNDAALAGGAVVSSVNDGSALWYNPAGLALSKKDSVDVGASAFVLRRYNMPGLLSADGGSGGNASFTEIVSVPSALTYVRRFSENIVGGVGLFSSDVSNYTLRSSLSVPLEQVQADIKILLTQQSSRYHLAGGLGAKLFRGLTAGFAVFGDYYAQSGLQQSSGIYTVSGAALGSQVTSTFSQDKLIGAHVRLGFTYEPRPWLRLGLSIQSGGGYIYRNMRITAVDTGTTPSSDATAFTLAASSADQSKSGATIGRYAPWRARFGGSIQVAGGTLSFEGDVQNKLKNDRIEIDRTFVWNLRAGARFAVNKALQLGAGLFTDRGAERRDAGGAGNIDFYGFTLGGQYEKVRWLAEQAPSGAGRPQQRTGLTFSSTVALRYAYGVGKLEGQHLAAPDYVAVDRAVHIGVHEITLHLGSGVYF